MSKRIPLATHASVVELCSDGLPLNVGSLPASTTALPLPGSLRNGGPKDITRHAPAGFGPNQVRSISQ
jgi:hypothetical protein